jgi:hypothetical protein
MVRERVAVVGCIMQPYHRPPRAEHDAGHTSTITLNPPPEHPLHVERHLVGAHATHARVRHHLGVDAVAVRAGLVDDPREHDRLAALGLDAARERGDLSHLDVVGDAFPVFERAVLSPDLAGLAGHPPVRVDLRIRDRQDESIDVLGHRESPLVGGSRRYDRMGGRNSSPQPGLVK